MIFYHGTNNEFKTFRTEYMQQNNIYGSGAYFAKDCEYAKAYGDILLTCEIPDEFTKNDQRQYLIGDELNDIPYSVWKKICKQIYDIDNTGFFNYGNYPEQKLINIVAKQLTFHEYLISAIFEISNCLYTDLTILEPFIPYKGIYMCRGNEITVWNPENITIIRKNKHKCGNPTKEKIMNQLKKY